MLGVPDEIYHLAIHAYYHIAVSRKQLDEAQAKYPEWFYPDGSLKSDQTVEEITASKVLADACNKCKATIEETSRVQKVLSKKELSSSKNKHPFSKYMQRKTHNKNG